MNNEELRAIVIRLGALAAKLRCCGIPSHSDYLSQEDAAVIVESERDALERWRCRQINVSDAQRITKLRELLARCNGVLVADGYDENEGLRKEVEDELGYT
jgi:hypothetical protein